MIKHMVMPKIYLTEAIDDQSILRILTRSNPINKADPKYNYYKKLAVWANSNRRQLSIKNVDLNTIKLSNRGLLSTNKLTTRYNSLGSLLDRLKNLMDQEGKYNDSAQAKLIQQTTLEILAGLSKIPNDTEEEKPKLYEGMDWTTEKAKRLANANGAATSDILEKFYSDYYNIEYAGGTSADTGDPNIVSRLKSLDKILIPEFNALGYNPAVNPLAQFLKILIKQKRDIFNKLTTNTYGAIHNSFIAKHITGNMLGNYSETNILFCDDLYNYKGLDIVNYLSLQEQVLEKAESSAKYADDKELIAKMFIQQQISYKDFAEKVKKLFDEPVSIKVVVPSDSDAKLRSELEVRELYRHLFKSTAKKAVTSKVVEEILEQAKSKDSVLSMIRYILDQNEFTNNRKYAQFAQETEKWLEKTIKYNQNDQKIAESKKILADYLLDATAENLIVRKLREYADEVRAANNKESS